MRILSALSVASICMTCGLTAPVPELPPRLEWEWIELGEPLQANTAAVAFSADGKLIAAGSGDVIGVWSVATGKPASRMRLPESQRRLKLAFSADGKTLAVDGGEDALQRFFDVGTGKQTREAERSDWFEIPGKKYTSAVMAFSPDATMFVEKVQSPHGDLRIAEIGTGKERIAAKNMTNSYGSETEIAFAPDGKTFAYHGQNNHLRIFETATGKLVRELRPPSSDPQPAYYPASVRYSPDGRFLLACELVENRPGRAAAPNRSQLRYVIWGVDTGKRHWQSTDAKMFQQGTNFPPAVLGPGNRYLIAGTSAAYDLLTEESVPIGKAPASNRSLLGASPDGSVLAFLGAPSSNEPGANADKMTVWLSPAPVLARAIRPGEKLTNDQAERMWKGIGSENLFRRQHSTAVLAGNPDLAVQFARARLKPVPLAEGERVAKLLKDFGDDDVDVRDRAQAELGTFGHQFEATLSAVLKKAPPGEVRNRLQSLARTTAETPPPAALLSDLRAVEFLNRLNTEGAKGVLEAVAAGAPGAKLTSAAAAALGR